MARVATAGGWARGLGGFDPFRAVYGFLTSVRIALMLLGAVAVSALLGVVFPQAADDVRAVPASYDAFTEFQRGRYGVFTTLMRRIGLFEVFHSYWFNGLIIVLLLAVAVCTANRIPPIARNVRRPVRKVNDRFFQSAHHRAEFATPANAEAIKRELRRRRYRVEETQRDGATYLFADRFPWAQYGTFISHLSLILFMSGAIVTKVVGFNTFISIPEGRSYPVFPTIHAGQMQVQNLHASDDANARGLPTRYHSELAVFRDGSQICRGTSTVNDPMHCAGYVLHQTAFSPDGVELQVKDHATGQVVYREVENLDAQGSTAPSPRLQVRDATGGLLFDDNVVLAPESGLVWYAVLPIKEPGTDAPLIVALAAVQDAKKQWTINACHVVSGRPCSEQPSFRLRAGDSGTLDGYTLSVPALNGVPVAVVQGIPGMETAAMLQLATAASGERYLDVINMGDGGGQLGVGTGDNPSPPSAASGTPQPAGAPPAEGRIDLKTGDQQTLGTFDYSFTGIRSVTGITVRRDPGSTFIWVATALLLIGLGITFYLPRRRLWARITPDRTYMAGVADRIVNFGAEMRRIGAAAGSTDAKPLDDD